jgi:hypothetical protein
MIEKNSKFAPTVGQWIPAVVTAVTGESSMLWHVEVGSRYREDGGFKSQIDLNYRDIQVQMRWISDKKCDLSCRAPGKNSRKDLHDSGYRGVLAIDRYVGRVAAIGGVDRSAWWVAVFTAYSAFDGPRSYDANELMKAASADDVQRVEELLAKGADVEAGDMIGATALCFAAESGALRTFKLLLANGANPKVVTSGGGTLLHSAAAGGNEEIISILMSSGLDLNARAQSGHTPLGWAIWSGKAEAALYLLRNGADPAAEHALRLCEEARLRFGADHLVTSMLCN